MLVASWHLAFWQFDDDDPTVVVDLQANGKPVDEDDEDDVLLTANGDDDGKGLCDGGEVGASDPAALEHHSGCVHSWCRCDVVFCRQMTLTRVAVALRMMMVTAMVKVARRRSGSARPNVVKAATMMTTATMTRISTMG